MPMLDRSKIPGGALYRPIYRAQFFLFIIDMLILGYIGYVPPTDQTIVIGQIASVVYFGTFFILPFTSKIEEKWLRTRGLPKQVEALIASEEQQIAQKKSGGK
jgi:ubiquinol-cytochrome c reductase cytochrome b subunit